MHSERGEMNETTKKAGDDSSFSFPRSALERRAAALRPEQPESCGTLSVSANHRDAERRGRQSHAERGNENSEPSNTLAATIQLPSPRPGIRPPIVGSRQ